MGKGAYGFFGGKAMPMCGVKTNPLLSVSGMQDRAMLTGRHIVRDVFCKNCNSKLGWMYEFATEEAQRYKEGKVILERALVVEAEGLEEYVVRDNRPPTNSTAARNGP